MSRKNEVLRGKGVTKGGRGDKGERKRRKEERKEEERLGWKKSGIE